MSEEALDRLDKCASEIKDNSKRPGDFAWMSKSEWLYVMLAANRHEELGETIAYALQRIGKDWVDELIKRHGIT